MEQKSRLAVEPVEADTVRLAFSLYLNGDGRSGALGVKEIVKWLNGKGYRNRNGNTFGVGTLHKMLTNTVYIGRWKFNQKWSKTGQRKPEAEIVEIAVPSIVDPDVFERVQRLLHARSPKVVAPRVTTGPILLTGLAVCATCRGGMTLRTGTSKNRKIYRYYTCANCATKGPTACKGRSIPMEKLDHLVIEHLSERLFQPVRLAALLQPLSARRVIKARSVNSRVMALQKEVTDADEKLRRLYRLVEEGLTELDDVLKDRLNALKAGRDRAVAALERVKELAGPEIRIDPALIETFGRTMQENFRTGSVPFRKAYLRALVDVIEVDDHQIRIKGSKDLLEKAVLAQNRLSASSQMSTGWRARRDSNSRPLDS